MKHHKMILYGTLSTMIITLIVITLFLMMYGLQQPSDSPYDSLPSENLMPGESESEEEPSTFVPDMDKDQKELILAFAGDTMAAGKMAPIIEEQGYQFPFEDVQAYLQEADYTMVNLETPVSKRGKAEEKTYAYQSHPDLIKGMQWAGIDAVTVANNHALDYGLAAFKDTLQYLNEAEIGVVGGGLNETDAYAEYQIEINDMTISYLGFSRVLPSIDWYATAHRAGLASGYQEDIILERIRQTAQNTHFTIIYMHWGEELSEEPDPQEQELAYRMIDEGADLIIGAHPHVLQRLEWYKGKLIAYSLGNFVFTTSHHPLARQSGVLQVMLDERKISHARFIPLKMEWGKVREVNDHERKEILQRLHDLSLNGVWEDEYFYMQ